MPLPQDTPPTHPDMITRCPHCRTAFRVSEEHLVPAAGEVQCGICNQRFDGVANLQPEAVAHSADSDITGAKSTIDRPNVEEIEIPVWAFNDLESSERPAEPTQSEDGVPEEQENRLRIDQATLDDDEAELKFSFSADDIQSQAVAAAATTGLSSREDRATNAGLQAPMRVAADDDAPIRRENEDILLEDLPQIEIDREEIDEIREYLRSGLDAAPPLSPWWGVFAALLLVTLLGQGFWYKREAILSQVPAVRSVWDRLCAGRFCELPVQRDLQALRVVSRDVREHPRYHDALLVNATLVNAADFSQPFPTVELVLFDRGGHPLGARRFSPSEYLDSSISPEAGIRPGQSVYIVLELASVGSQAVSFEFRFL